MQLIAYADRLGGDLRGLLSLLDSELRGLFSGVHVLPFFDPIDGADAGFDPVDHTRVDPRLGGWSDVRALASSYTVMADLIVNHVSAGSAEFKDVLVNGRSSPHWQLFLKREDVFPETGGSAAESRGVDVIYRPRPGLPFTSIRLDSGEPIDFWTTFSANQLDISVEIAAGQAYLDGVLQKLASASVREIRLDAAGYAIKRPNTSCFMLPETYEFIAKLSERASELGMDALVEVHSHYETQIAIALHVGRVYDFALPPLILHALYTSEAGPCRRWLGIAPRNCITVLDTHDGIGILDVAGDGERDGLLSEDEIDNLVETIHERTRGNSRRASGHAASNVDVYQVNSTYYDALGRSDTEYLIARAVQFFSPGTPQVYYVGLLAGMNDMELVERTGVGRDINRHYYSRDEIREALQRPVVADLVRLIRLRRDLSAFDGDFSIGESEGHELVLRWDADQSYAELYVDFRNRRATIEYSESDGAQRIRIDNGLVEATGTPGNGEPAGDA